MFSGGFSEVFFHQNSLKMLHQRGDSGAIDFQDKGGARNRHGFVEKNGKQFHPIAIVRSGYAEVERLWMIFTFPIFKVVK